MAYCPYRNDECKDEECMLFVVGPKGVRLGCAHAVMAKQLDKLAFHFKKQEKPFLRDVNETEEFH